MAPDPFPPNSLSLRPAGAGLSAVALAVELAGLCWGGTSGVLILAAPDGRRLVVQLSRADALALVRQLRQARVRHRLAEGHVQPPPPARSSIRAVGLASGENGAPVGLLAVGRPGMVRELACSPGAAAFWAVLLDLPVWVTDEDLAHWAAVSAASPTNAADEPRAAFIRQLLAEIDALDRL